MKKLIIYILFLCLTILGYSQKNHQITITISGFSNNKGKAMVALYNQEKDFLKKGIRHQIVSVKNKKATLVFKNLPKGTYAVSMFHDANNNRKLDTNFFGIPTEDYGCSNNAKGFMGPPKFKDAKFILSSNKTTNIKLN